MRGNILDLVITNCEDNFSDLRVKDSDKYSDHFQVLFSFMTTRPCDLAKSYDYSKADFDGMCSFLLDHEFSDFYQSANIDELWFQLKSILQEAVVNYVPLVRISNSNTPKWFNSEIRHHINRLRYRRRQFRIKPSNAARSTLDFEEKILQEKINKARSTWERNLVDEFAGSSNHKIYTHIRSLSNSSSLPSPMFLETSDPQVQADLFN